jgi:hypothetical protein
MGITRNIALDKPVRKLAGTVAIGLAACACAVGVGPSNPTRIAPGVEGIAYSVSAPPAATNVFHANDSGFTVNDTTGNAAVDDAKFPVGGLAFMDAETIAVRYWNAVPCNGVINVSWQSMDPSINGDASWWNPIAAYGNAAANAQCSITLNTAQDYSWPMLCTVVTHEFGHLAGHDHVTDQKDVMYPVYVGPIPECQAPPAGVPIPASAATASATRTHVNATAASHTTTVAKKHKKHKSTKKSTKKKSTKK